MCPLATPSLAVTNKDGKAVLQPFPSWADQDQNDPTKIINAQSMIVDSKGIMWILDVGRVRWVGPHTA
jgi:hypothetical protein